MDEHRETFTKAFVVEQQGDGPGRLVRSIETHPDGTQIVTEYEDVPSAADPYVRSRRRTAGDDPPHEIATVFLPAPVRPLTYPAGFPFVAERECYTTESPANTLSPGARWRCNDPEVLMAALIDVCIGDGWTEAPAPSILAQASEYVDVAFKRGEERLLLHRIDLEGGSVLSMLVLDNRLFDSTRDDPAGGA